MSHLPHLFYHCPSLIWSLTGVEIGFFQTQTTVAESAGIAQVEFGVLSGQLGREISVDLDFASGTATGLVDLNSLVFLPNK